MAEFKNIARINIVTDTETAMYKMGEVEGGFNEKELQKHILNYGASDLLTTLCKMQSQIWNTIIEINRERGRNDEIKCVKRN